MSDAFELRPRPIYRVDPPVIDERYLRMIRKLCCVVCACSRGVEAAYFGPKGTGQKASDLDALPLCHRCHRTGPASYHKLGEQAFVAAHNLNVKELQMSCRAAYRRIYGAKAA